MRASIAASRRSVFASLPIASGEAAGLTGIDLDEGNAGRAQGALEGAVIGAGRLEDQALGGVWANPFTNALRPHLSLAKRRLAPAAKRWGSGRSFATSTPMVSFCIFSAPLLVIRGSPPSIRPGQRKRRGRSNSSSTRQTVSELPIRPSPLTRGQPPSPSGSFSPPWRQKS